MEAPTRTLAGCVFVFLSFLPDAGVLAQSNPLTESIDLTDPSGPGIGLLLFSQADPRWADVLIGPNEDVPMRSCGCKLAVFATLLDYQIGRNLHVGGPLGFSSEPWFPTPQADGSFHFFFSPSYLHLYLKVGRTGLATKNFGYDPIPPKTCGVMVSDDNLVDVAKPLADIDPSTGKVTVRTPTGYHLDRIRGFGTAAKDLINDNLRKLLPTPVRICDKNGACHMQLIAGWDNDRQKYRILDPAWNPLFALQEYGNRAQIPPDYDFWTSMIEDVFDLKLDFSGLDLVHYFWIRDDPAPIELLVVNPEGRRTGFDPATRTILREDPGSSYVEDGAWTDPLGTIPPGDPVKGLTVRAAVEGIYRVEVTGTGDGPFHLAFSTTVQELETPLQTVNDVITKGQILKYEVHFSNTAPSSVSQVANFTPEARTAHDVAGLTNAPVLFNGSRSFDVDGSIVAYNWEFGDGTTAAGSRVSHVYTAPGTYSARLTVVDDAGASSAATITATIMSAEQGGPVPTERVSVSSSGEQGNGLSGVPDPPIVFDPGAHFTLFQISGDGRYVAFESFANSLVPDDTNGEPDIFVHDRATRTTKRVSVSSTGAQANGPSFAPSVSADGRYAAFVSEATNLVPGDINGVSDIFVRDRLLGTTERVSVSNTGAEANDRSILPSISADGRYVAFVSDATNLVTTDTAGVESVFVRDRLRGTTELVSVSSGGVPGNGQSSSPSISADGRHVAFVSDATNLVAGDTNDLPDIFVRDRLLGTTERVNLSHLGTQSNRISHSPSISGDGRYVAFTSFATLVEATAFSPEVYVRDRLLGTTERVNPSGILGFSYFPSISADGRYVAFRLEPRFPFETRPAIFLRDRQAQTTERVSVSSAGDLANGQNFAPSVNANGSAVAFTSEASNLVSGDTNGVADLFVRGRLRLKPVADPSGPYLGFAAKPQPPASIQFDSRKSFDPNNLPLRARWNFGDGSPEVPTSSLGPVSHSYSAPGTYTVTLIVSNGVQDSDPATTTADVQPALASSHGTFSASPACGLPGTAINFELGPFPLVSLTGGFDVGGAAQPPTPQQAFGADRVVVSFQGPASGTEMLRFSDLSLSFASAAAFSAGFVLSIPSGSGPGTYAFSIGADFPLVSVTVPCPPQNHVPVADAGGPYRAGVGQTITFDGSRSFDPDGDPLTYKWYFDDGTTGTGVSPRHSYATPGEYLVTLVVRDGKDSSMPSVIPANSRRSFAVVTVSGTANRPPLCSAAAPSVGILWPPNHRLVPVQITGVTDPDQDAVTIQIDSVTQDEPVNGLGDGDTSPDAVIQGNTVLVRAERSGSGNGRVYRINFTAADGRGESCNGSVRVTVPHSMKPGTAAIDDGQLYDSTRP